MKTHFLFPGTGMSPTLRCGTGLRGFQGRLLVSVVGGRVTCKRCRHLLQKTKHPTPNYIAILARGLAEEIDKALLGALTEKNP